MAFTITQLGTKISTEKLVYELLQGDPVTFTEAIMQIVINDASNDFELQHLPVLGTDDVYRFEINSIVKDYFSGEFLPLTGANQSTLQNALVWLLFSQVDTNGTISGGATPLTVVVKNITQDIFEIEDFNITDYDCGDAGSTSSKLLTSSPDPLPIGDLTSIHVSCLTTSYTGGTTPKQEWFIQTLLSGVVVATTNEAVFVPDRSVVGFSSPAKVDISTYRFDFDSSTGIDEVRFYIRDIASPFTIRSETKVYKLRNDCEKTITLSWLNEFGAQDSFTFAGNINRVGKYTDSTFKRIRPVNPLSTDVGDLVYKSSYNYEYDLFSDRMPESTVQWLSKILINKRAAIQGKKIPLIFTGSLNTSQLTPAVVGGAQYGTAVDGGNGFMYVIPNISGLVLKINIATGVITSFSSGVAGGTPKWFGAEVAPNGKIYCIPYFSDNVLVIDPSNDTTATLAVPTTLGFFIKWVNSAITSTGVIYAFPTGGSGTTTTLKIDTNTDTVTEFSGVANQISSCGITSNDIIYAFGAGSATAKLITATDTVLTIGVIADSIKSQRSFVIGNIMYAFSGLNIYKLNISNDTITSITTATAGLVDIWGDSVLAGDGSFYFPGSSLQKFDPVTELATTIVFLEASPQWDRAAVDNSGSRIYGIPNATNEILEVALDTKAIGTSQKYFPIVITTDETTLEDKFTPETLFRLKFRLANSRKGIK